MMKCQLRLKRHLPGIIFFLSSCDWPHLAQCSISGVQNKSLEDEDTQTPKSGDVEDEGTQITKAGEN